MRPSVPRHPAKLYLETKPYSSASKSESCWNHVILPRSHTSPFRKHRLYDSNVIPLQSKPENVTSPPFSLARLENTPISIRGITDRSDDCAGCSPPRMLRSDVCSGVITCYWRVNRVRRGRRPFEAGSLWLVAPELLKSALKCRKPKCQSFF